MVTRKKGVPYIWSDCKLHRVGRGRRVEGMVVILNEKELSEVGYGLMPDDDEVEEEEEDGDEVDPEDLWEPMGRAA